jgi:hypothetical protein
MTAASLDRPAPGSVPPATPGARHGSAYYGWRLAWLYLVSRRVPMALALLALLGALLWAALHWHWSIAGGAAARQFIPLTLETGSAAVIAVTTYGPFGESERAAGRWLPWLRLGAAPPPPRHCSLSRSARLRPGPPPACCQAALSPCSAISAAWPASACCPPPR